MRLATVLLAGLVLLVSCQTIDDTLGTSFDGPPPPKEFAGGEPYQVDQPHNIPGTVNETAPPPMTVNIPPNREENGMVMGMKVVPETLPAGGVIQVRLALRNMTSNSKPVRYSTEQRFDVAIYSDPKQESLVHLWSADQLFGEVASEFSLGPGSNVSRTLEIATSPDRATAELMGSDLNKPLVPGYYYVWGMHEGTPHLATGPVEIAVTE